MRMPCVPTRLSWECPGECHVRAHRTAMFPIFSGPRRTRREFRKPPGAEHCFPSCQAGAHANAVGAHANLMPCVRHCANVACATPYECHVGAHASAVCVCPCDKHVCVQCPCKRPCERPCESPCERPCECHVSAHANAVCAPTRVPCVPMREPCFQSRL